MSTTMNENDSTCLLKECDAGTKMAVSSIDEVIEKIRDSKLKELLTESKGHHEKLRNDIQRLLNGMHSEEKEPNPMAKSMSWLKTNMKLGVDDSDHTIADLITDGCNMGIKSLYHYLNHYAAADKDSQNVCRRLISIEEELRKDLYCYL